MKAIKAYYPNRLAKNLSDPLTAFNTEMLLPVGVFSAQTESDLTYAIVPLRYMQALTQYDHQLTSIEVYIKPDVKSKQIQAQLGRLMGDKFEIKSRYQQEELMYKVMKMENLVVFIILSFILFLATFNIVGTISMLIIEKKKDVEILKNMGADKSLIERIFIAEGVLINLFGGGLGLIIGALICILQQQFGLITMGQDNARYALNSYPVDMQLVDFLMVFGIITFFGFLSTWIPVKRIVKASFCS
jgi:lipoprotein-releasing system permease protein